MSTDKATIDSYNQNAHLWAGKMRSGKNYAHLFIEKPAMALELDLIGDLSNLKILALGCGSGEEVELLISKGAKPENIIGIDISEKLIEIAKASFADIEFLIMDIEKLVFEDQSFDLVYSSLVLHYLEDWTKALNEVYRVLKKGGKFLFSTHHPLAWGVGNFESGKSFIRSIGYEMQKDNREKINILGTYLTKSPGQAKWFNGAMKINYFNRSISEMFKYLKNTGFSIINLIEPKVLDEAKEKDLKLWSVHKDIPLFIIWHVENL